MIIYCCADLIFATKIRSTAQAVGIVTRPVRNRQMLEDRLNQVDDGKPHEPVTALLIDLTTGDAGIELITQAKSADPALHVLAFGSHIATDLLDAARTAGADTVMTRGAFTGKLPALLNQLVGHT